MEPAFREIDAGRELEDVAEFLCAHDWPFHGTRRPSKDQARGMRFGPPTARSFWIDVEGGHVGLLLVRDLEDVGTGSPVFDIRIEPGFRGHGIGRRAVEWLVRFVFREYPEAHRIEATVRIDNAAMRKVLEGRGFMLEGRLRETWPAEEGVRMDTALYGLLRGDLPDDGPRV